jgi:uncharacterized protein HemX
MNKVTSEKEKHRECEMPFSAQAQPVSPVSQMSIVSSSKDTFLGVCVIVAALIIGGVWIYVDDVKNVSPEMADAKLIADLEKTILPDKGH